MGFSTFKGGIHTYDGKDISKDKPIQKVVPKGDMVYPLIQHIGAPAKPLVNVNEKVFVGQIIAKIEGFVSSNIISSVSGKVKAIEERIVANGSKIQSIVVENDNEYSILEGIGVDRDYNEFSKEEIRECIKEAGIVGMGGAGFPTHIKLTPKNEDEIDYILINGAECEPYLTSDYRCMLEYTDELIGGIKVILRLFPKAKAVIGIEANKMDAIELLEKAVKDEEKISVKALKVKYPQGAERQLIYAITGRKLNSSKLPADIGCIVNNIDTVISIYMAVCKSTPLIRRILTVTGNAIANPSNFEVPIGMNYMELIEAAGGFKTEPEKVISGGPMMGNALYTLDIPVTKTSSTLLCFTKDEVAMYEPTACIRCGRCVEVCPSRLVPQKMLEYSDRFDDEGFKIINGMECYECGSCTYVCPAKRRLTQSFKQTRRSVLAKK